MGSNVGNTRSGEEVARLLELISKAPKATTDATPEPDKPRNDKWKTKAIAGMKVRSHGRVNRTKGK
jgi:hypothetical protein